LHAGAAGEFESENVRFRERSAVSTVEPDVFVDRIPILSSRKSNRRESFIPSFCGTCDNPGRSPFVGPSEGFRRRDRDKPRTPEKNPSGKKPAAAKSEPVTKN
jgi:hypothetical protein